MENSAEQKEFTAPKVFVSYAQSVERTEWIRQIGSVATLKSKAWFYPSPAAANRPFWIATVGLSRLVELGTFWVQRRSDPIPGCLRPSKSCHGLRQPLRSLFNGQQPVFFTYLAIPMIVFEAPISPSRSAGSPQSLARI